MSSYFSAGYIDNTYALEHQPMDQLLRLGSHAPTDQHLHPLVTFGRDGDEEEKPKPRIKPSQIYQNFKKVKPKTPKHAASKGST